MLKKALYAAIVALLPLPAMATDGIAGLDWMAGHWCGDNHGVHNEEVWLPPRAGVMVGVHRDSRGDAPAGFEYFRIVENGGELVYWTQPKGAPAIAFRGRAAVDAVDFVNPEHDFPKRIRYRRVDDHTLQARIDDGGDDGQAVVWTWHRDCGLADGNAGN